MPYKKRKNPNGTYTVSSPTSVHSTHATKENADAQIRLLNAIEHGYDPKAAKTRKKSRKGSRSQY